MAKALRFGLIGCGRIAKQILPTVLTGKGYKIVAAAARDPKLARGFADQFKIESEPSYASLLRRPDIDAVYISLPESLHAPWSIKAANAGKHVLCEKTLAPSLAAVRAALAAAKRNRVRLLEAFMWDFASRAADLKKRASKLGRLKAMHSTFGFILSDKKNFRNFTRFGGGALNDIGCYCLNASRKLLGEPTHALARLLSPGSGKADMHGSALLEFKGGALATMEFSFSSAGHQTSFIVGEKGVLDFPGPFRSPYDPDPRYRMMFEAFSKEVSRQPGRPGKFEADALLQARGMDALRRAAKSGKRVKV